MITLSPPTFVTGALLSASMLNTLTECANALQGASQAPTGIFYRTGNDNTYWMRRKWDYLHVTYQTSGDDATTKIFVNGTQIWSDETLRPAGYTHNTSLVGISGGPAVGDFYRVEVRYTDEDNASTNTLNVFESNQLSSAVQAGGTYTSPHSWGATDTPTAAQLNTISTAITQLAPIIVSPSPVLYRVTTSTTFTLQRRLRYLNVAYNASGDASNRLLVNGTSVYNEETTGNGITVQIDLTGVSGGPAVGGWYSFEFRNQSGAAMLTDLYESGTVPADYAPTWSHGDTLPNATNLNKYKTVLDAVEAITDVIPWHHAITYKTVDHPQWTLRKTKRYLHYIRNGSTAATLKDPASVYDDTSLSTDSTGYGSLDLDSVDWLAPGGTFYVHEADTLWLDEEA